MRLKLRDFDAESKSSCPITVGALQRVIPMEGIAAALRETGVCTQRKRKLGLEEIVWWVIAMNLFRSLSLRAVMEKLTEGDDWTDLDRDERRPGANALVYRRYQLGARPMVALFRRICRPMATAETQGAFRWGLRLMAIDGSVEDVPDTPETVAAFGRASSSRGKTAFPQVKGVYLVECGTHAIVDAGFWPYRTSERVGGFRLLRSVGPDMLVLWDRGFHDFDMLRIVRERGAHVLARLPAHVQPQKIRDLPDGSYLAWLLPSEYSRRKDGERLQVRIVEYTITDPTLEGYGEIHRIITTLLDPKIASAMEVACTSHERWEIELTIDEKDTHQRLAGLPLRSRKSVGVLQELYGLLIAPNAIRFLMHEAAQSTRTDPDRLSFTHALRVIQAATPYFQIADPAHLPQLYDKLLHEIARGRLPERRLRVNPRCVKRKMSKFPVKSTEQRPPPQPLRPFQQAIRLI